MLKTLSLYWENSRGFMMKVVVLKKRLRMRQGLKWKKLIDMSHQSKKRLKFRLLMVTKRVIGDVEGKKISKCQRKASAFSLNSSPLQVVRAESTLLSFLLLFCFL